MMSVRPTERQRPLALSHGRQWGGRLDSRRTRDAHSRLPSCATALEKACKGLLAANGLIPEDPFQRGTLHDGADRRGWEGQERSSSIAPISPPAIPMPCGSTATQTFHAEECRGDHVMARGDMDILSRSAYYSPPADVPRISRPTLKNRDKCSGSP